MTSLLEQQSVPKFRILRRISYFFDKNDSLLILISVISLIILIITIFLIVYTNYLIKKNKKTEKTEKFIGDSNSDSNSDSKKIKKIETENKNISDELNKITNEITPILNKYKYLDVPININNTGKKCGNWSNYMDGTYSNFGSKCVNIDDTEPSEYYCVNTSDNSLVSCNNYISPNTIQNLNINTTEIISKNNTQFVDAIANYVDVCNNFDIELTGFINTIKSAGSIANNQNYFYENNQNNLEVKKNLTQSFKQIYEDDTDDINIKKDNILHYREMTNELKKSNDTMYNISKYLFIIFIILLIGNIFLTRI